MFSLESFSVLRSAVVVAVGQDHKGGSGLPIPTNASRRQAWISWLIRFSWLRSCPCQ